MIQIKMWSILQTNPSENYLCGLVNDTPLLIKIDKLENDLAYCGENLYQLTGAQGHDDRIAHLVVSWRIDNKINNYSYLNYSKG